MLKKVALAGGLLAGLPILGTVAGVPLVSHAKTGVAWLCDSTTDAMPLEWELDRARTLIQDLEPEIERGAKQIAIEKVEVGRLESQLERGGEQLAKSESDIRRLTDDLKADAVSYTYAGREYTPAQVRQDLSSRFDRHQTRAATVAKWEQMLDARRASLQSARERLDAMTESRRQLEVEVEGLQARLAALRVTQTTSGVSFDDGALSQTRDLIDTIAARIEVEEETTAVDTSYHGGIQLDEPEDGELLDRIATYFDGGRADGSGGEALVSIQLD